MVVSLDWHLPSKVVFDRQPTGFSAIFIYRSHTNCPVCRAGIVPLEPTSRNPVVMEEDDRELRMGPESVASELRIGIYDANGESMAQIGLTNNENRNNDAVGLLQPMRRSVSVDSFPASPITAF